MTTEAAGSVLGSRSRPRHTTAHLLAGLPFEEDQQRGLRQSFANVRERLTRPGALCQRAASGPKPQRNDQRFAR